MMRRPLWSLGLATALSTATQCAVASKAVNVALQASFRSPPYLLELLLVTISLPCPRDKILMFIEKQLRKKTRRRTSLSLTELQKGASLTAAQTRIFTRRFYRSFKMTGTSQTLRFYHLFNLRFRYTPQPLGSRHIINITTHRWSQI